MTDYPVEPATPTAEIDPATRAALTAQMERRASTAISIVNDAAARIERDLPLLPDQYRRLGTCEQYLAGEAPAEIGARVRCFGGSWSRLIRHIRACHESLVKRGKAATEAAQSATAALKSGRNAAIDDRQEAILRNLAQDSETAKAALQAYLTARSEFQLATVR